MQRVALVTGGMGGLGEAICIKLAALGYKVVTTYSPTNTKAQDWLRSMNDMGYGFKAYPCDVTDYEACRACIRQIEKDIGSVDVLVNNAGALFADYKLSPDGFEMTFALNRLAYFLLTQELQALVEKTANEHGAARIINVASTAGIAGYPYTAAQRHPDQPRKHGHQWG